MHTKRLALLKGEPRTSWRKYLFMGIGGFYTKLYVGIDADNSTPSAFNIRPHSFNSEETFIHA